MVESVLVMLSPAFCDFGWCSMTLNPNFKGRPLFEVEYLGNDVR